jgi:glycosyltransferase involved in cell wall biosynthesis
MPKVSVVIPTYNRARYLKRAIQSILDQTFQDFEIIVVDDGSTDETPETVKAFQDARIGYFRHDTNRQEARARNTGVRNSVGEYIAFLDDDDTWLPQKLAMQVNLLDKSPSKVGAVYCSALQVDGETGRVLFQWNAKKRGNIFRDLSEQNWIGIPSNIILRRQCFDTLGLFDEQIEFGLDYDMWVRVAKAYEFDFLSEPLVLRSAYHKRLSTNYKLVLKGTESMLRKYADYFSLNKRAYSYRLLAMGVLYCYNGQVRTARATFLKAIRLNPLEIRNYYNLALSLLGAENYTKIKDLRARMASQPLYRAEE